VAPKPDFGVFLSFPRLVNLNLLLLVLVRSLSFIIVLQGSDHDSDIYTNKSFFAYTLTGIGNASAQNGFMDLPSLTYLNNVLDDCVINFLVITAINGTGTFPDVDFGFGNWTLDASVGLTFPRMKHFY